jgi:hypothetical protein
VHTTLDKYMIKYNGDLFRSSCEHTVIYSGVAVNIHENSSLQVSVLAVLQAVLDYVFCIIKNIYRIAFAWKLFPSIVIHSLINDLNGLMVERIRTTNSSFTIYLKHESPLPLGAG